jgi:sarcosine oxidase
MATTSGTAKPSACGQAITNTVTIRTPESVDRRIRDDDIAEMRAVLRDFLPAVDGELVQAATCLYTLTPDLNFIIGPHPRHAQVKVAAGFSGHGFKFCSVVGEILSNLVVTGRAGHDIRLFDPLRFGSTPPL